MKKVLKDLFIKKELHRSNDAWREYAKEARSQFVALSEKGITIRVVTY